MYGVDVAKTRADDLDKKLLSEVEKGNIRTVLDVGCGSGGQSKRLAATGAEVVALDVTDYSADFLEVDEIKFVQADLSDVMTAVEGCVFDSVLVQRTIHYLPYKQALEFLKALLLLSDRLFISVTGLESDIGQRFPQAGKPVEDRFARLSLPEQAIFNITEPICPYSETEFMNLLQTAGWEIEEFWLSAFGNIKAICASS